MLLHNIFPMLLMVADEAMGLFLGHQHALCRAFTCSSQADGVGPQGQNAELRQSLRYMASVPICVALGAPVDISGKAVHHGGLQAHSRVRVRDGGKRGT